MNHNNWCFHSEVCGRNDDDLVVNIYSMYVVPDSFDVSTSIWGLLGWSRWGGLDMYFAVFTKIELL